MAVGILTWPLIQKGWFFPNWGQLPQYKPVAQSVGAEHDSSNCFQSIINIKKY